MNVRRAIIKTGDVTLEVEGRFLELAANRRALGLDLDGGYPALSPHARQECSLA